VTAPAGGITIAPADAHKPWAQKAFELRLRCTCWSCLREAGITPDGGAHAQHRRTSRAAASTPAVAPEAAAA
jgi:hypothetical protein